MKTNLVYLLAMLAIISSCKKSVEDKYKSLINNNSIKDISVNKMQEIKVPDNFDWRMSKEVNLIVSVDATINNNDIGIVSVYTNNPAEGGILIAKGSATSAKAFAANIEVAKTLNSLFIEKVGSDNAKISQTVNIFGTTANAHFSHYSNVSLGKKLGPNCSSGCTTTVNNPSNDLTYTSGTICLTGNLTIKKLTIDNSAIVRICGTGTIEQFDFKTSTAEVIITSTSNVTMTRSSIVKGKFTNYGIYTTLSGKDITLKYSATFTNFGTASFDGKYKTDGTSITLNNGTMDISDALEHNSGNTFTNNCKVLVSQDFKQKGLFHNYGYLKCYANSEMDGSSGNEFKQYNGAMLSTKDIEVKKAMIGYGTNSLIKVSHLSKGSSSGSVTGAQQYCDLNGIESSFAATIGSGATISCSLNIATTSCNPEGNGNPTPTDTDNDGIPDALDEYPTDPNMAFNSYYPSQNGIATLAFEDMWPYIGDFDLNDVVVCYKYKVVTNASNIVVKVVGTYILCASGGTNNNGFGVQFPIDRTKIGTVTGGTLETGQSKAVLVVFNDMRSQMVNWNTNPTVPTSDTVIYNVTFMVNNGPTISTFGLSEYNPFIWNGTTGFGRGYEVHLPGKLPTDLANQTLYGTKNDDTNISQNRTYVSKNGGYPWAISVPEKFYYPKEKVDINTAYLKFASWVSSNGFQFNDWYTNAAGYRNANNIF